LKYLATKNISFLMWNFDCGFWLDDFDLPSASADGEY